MTISERERHFYGKNVQVVIREDDCVIYRLIDESGEAVLTRYEVYPGISLVYNDVHREEISIEDVPKYQNVLEINHCREGRIEFESSTGEYLYIKKGDMSINTKAGVKNNSYFPQCHYHGVTIEIDLDVIQKQTLQVLKDFGVETSWLNETFGKQNRCFILHEKAEFEHLFAELYRVPEKIRKRYYKLKVIEILLFLSVIDVKQEHIQNCYFNKDLVAVIKEVHSYMINNLSEKITINMLAESFKISPTTLKKCFREVYGISIYAYLKEYRIHKAAELLRTSELEIGKIAGMVGYDNASKFAESFKRAIGINPSQYKKSV